MSGPSDDSDLDSLAGNPLTLLTATLAESFEAQLAELMQEKGTDVALAFVLAGIPVCTKHLALTMGAGYAIEYLESLAKPFRDFLTAHGGPGTGVHQ